MSSHVAQGDTPARTAAGVAGSIRSRNDRHLWRVLAGALALLALNYYIVRDGFHVVHTGHMNAMHGFWMGLARLADVHWFRPAWWPYADAGSPFEFLYAPLVPGLTALWSRVGQIPISQAFFCVTSLAYLLGPVTLYLMAVGLTRAPGPSFAAGLLYTLTSMTGLLVPDRGFAFHLFDDRRMYLSGLWDDTPHLLALTILPLALLFVARACIGIRPGRDAALAVLLCTLTAWASVFGAVMLVVGVICLLIALGREQAVRHVATAAGIGLAAYAAASPFLTPSLLQVIRRDAAASGNGWSVESWSSLSLVVLASVICWHLISRWTTEWTTRFFMLFAVVTAGIPAASEFLNRQFLPQPGRYTLELDLAWPLLVAFAVRPLWRRLPRSIAAAVVLVLVSFGAEQVVMHRKYVKEVLFPVDIKPKIEYRLSRWLREHLSHERVFLPGSLDKWYNAFSDGEQFGGSSFSTAYNPVQQTAQHIIFGDVSAQPSLLWLQAFGVQAIAMTGPQSQEYWKPYAHPDKFAGVLEPLWSEPGTTLYRVPQRSASYAHVVPVNGLVLRAPDQAQLARYVAALQDTPLPLATWRWRSHSDAEIETTVRPGEAVSLQVSYAPGWRATVNGASVPLRKDGLGFMYLQPVQAGPCHIELRFTGSLEEWLCRIVSYTVLLGTLAYLAWDFWQRRRAVPHSIA